MSESWGTTGRVTVGAVGVLVDGRYAGIIFESNDQPGSWFATGVDEDTPGVYLPSRDAAVMWVLRRTAPDVWRAERPVVWRACPVAYSDVPVNVRAADMHARADLARAAR